MKSQMKAAQTLLSAPLEFPVVPKASVELTHRRGYPDRDGNACAIAPVYNSLRVSSTMVGVDAKTTYGCHGARLDGPSATPTAF